MTTQDWRKKDKVYTQYDMDTNEKFFVDKFEKILKSFPPTNIEQFEVLHDIALELNFDEKDIDISQLSDSYISECLSHDQFGLANRYLQSVLVERRNDCLDCQADDFFREIYG